MESLGTRRVVKIGTVALLYTLLMVVLRSWSFGGLQFRLAEVLMVLCLYSKDIPGAVTLGCFAANVFGPNGAPEMLIGTAATSLAGILIYRFRKRLNPFFAGLICAAVNGPATGAVLLMNGTGSGFAEDTIQIAVSEFLVVAGGGYILRLHLRKLDSLREFIYDKE